MRTWQQGGLFLAGQESRKCCVLISDVWFRRIYTLGTLNQNNWSNNVIFFIFEYKVLSYIPEFLYL